MSETMRSHSYSAEYYFEYKIEKIFGEENIKTPKLYFEKDCTSQAYALYIAPEEWLEQQDVLGELKSKLKDNKDLVAVRQTLDKLEYEEVVVTFDISGVDCAVLSDEESDDFRKAEIKNSISFESFFGAGCKLMLEKQKATDFSGAGVIQMIRADQVVAKFFFAINFAFRKKISYSIEIARTKAILAFYSKDRPQNISVRLVYCPERLPCLRNDMGANIVKEFTLDFSECPTYKLPIDLPFAAQDPKNVFSVTMTDEKLARFYLLDCVRNTSIYVSRAKALYPTVGYTCPYCHKAIDAKVASDPKYKRGGMPCQATTVNAEGKPLPTVISKNRSKQKKCLYCVEDLNSEGVSFAEARLLPPAFMEHDNFKIAFAGSTRAGKTTYISRFFEVSGGEKISMSMEMMANSLGHLGIDVQRASIPSVKGSEGGWMVTDVDWTTGKTQYRDRSINLFPHRYPSATLEGDYTKFPFVAEVNKKTYVSFYDIAGEDAQSTKRVENIANDEPIGIFCIINGKADESGNKKVIEMLKSARLNEHCPIAVIVTKMDMLESKFDVHSRCLRTDYFDGSKRYEGSALQREIDYSSEEIRSYLWYMNLLPNFGQTYSNVKYFGVSSFNFLDSIHRDHEDPNAPGRVRFLCSAKRMELPFVWMLKQFGVIN